MEYTYTLDEIQQAVNTLKKFFDLIRIVNPLNMVECNLNESTKGNLKYNQYLCYSVWAKNGRCENCISLRALGDNVRKTKYEFIEKDVYYVVAVPVIVDKERFVLEIVNDVTDDVLLGAFGHNEFVKRITEYNAKVYQDTLTGVFNRKYLSEQIFLDYNLSQERKMKSVAIINVDHFKIINSVQSQAFGDKILIKLAQFLKEQINNLCGDYIVRFGGDEFLLVFNELSPEDFEKEIHQISKMMKREFSDITVCIGGAAGEEYPGASLEKLISYADGRLFSAKENGRDMIVLKE